MMELLGQNQMFIVLTIVLLTWAGIVWYLTRLDRRLKRLEDRSKEE
jgi:CcmD family protein